MSKKDVNLNNSCFVYNKSEDAIYLYDIKAKNMEFLLDRYADSHAYATLMEIFKKYDSNFIYGDLLAYKNTDTKKICDDFKVFIPKVEVKCSKADPTRGVNREKSRKIKKQVMKKVIKGVLPFILLGGSSTLAYKGIKDIINGDPEIVNEADSNIIISDDEDTIKYSNFIDYSTFTSKEYNRASKYLNSILKVSKKYDIDARLLLAIAFQESDCDHENTKNGNSSGDYGIMQVNNAAHKNEVLENYDSILGYNTKEKVTLDKLKDADKNIDISGRILQNYLKNVCIYLSNKQKLNPKDLVSLGVLAYNQGLNNVKKNTDNFTNIGDLWECETNAYLKSGDPTYTKHVYENFEKSSNILANWVCKNGKKEDIKKYGNPDSTIRVTVRVGNDDIEFEMDDEAIYKVANNKSNGKSK